MDENDIQFILTKFSMWGNYHFSQHIQFFSVSLYRWPSVSFSLCFVLFCFAVYEAKEKCNRIHSWTLHGLRAVGNYLKISQSSLDEADKALTLVQTICSFWILPRNEEKSERAITLMHQCQHWHFLKSIFTNISSTDANK